jgi:uncharacterized membrane protein
MRNAWTFFRFALLARIILIVVGGYVASAGFVATVSALLPMFGVVRSEAVILGSILGFILYVALVLWGFAAHQSWRFLVTLVLLIGGGLVAFLTGAGR